MTCFVCFMSYYSVCHSKSLSTVCSPRKTLVVLDSRGRRLLMDNPNIICCAYPGATLSTIRPKIELLITRHNPLSCLVMVGVNDLTICDYMTRQVRVADSDPFVLANIVIERILTLRKSVLEFWPGIRLVFAGITGLDLNKYNRQLGVSIQQWVIDDAILQINSYVRILNRSDGHYHPRLTSKVHIWRKGRRVSRYHLLRDGLHPGPIVISSWIRAIFRFHRKNTLGLNS